MYSDSLMFEWYCPPLPLVNRTVKCGKFYAAVEHCECVAVCIKSVRLYTTFAMCNFSYDASHPSTADCNVVSSTRHVEVKRLVTDTTLIWNCCKAVILTMLCEDPVIHKDDKNILAVAIPACS